MPTDPLFYLCAGIAVVLVGISKGGFGGAGAVVAVPIISLYAPPLVAVSVMLPVMVVMDAIAVWAYRRRFDVKTLIYVLPSAVLGTFVTWTIVGSISPDALRLAIGLLAILFVATYCLEKPDKPAAGHQPVWAIIAGLASAVGSFIAHAGGPPFQMYLARLRLEPAIYAGTGAVFFAIINLLKLGPYAELGQLTRPILMTAFVLAPVSIAATYLGVWLTKHLKPLIYYRIIYALLAAVSVKLIWDGVRGLVG